MQKIRCEYCRRPTFVDDLECIRCGAPLPIIKQQESILEASRGYTTSTAATDYYIGQTVWEVASKSPFTFNGKGWVQYE